MRGLLDLYAYIFKRNAVFICEKKLESTFAVFFNVAVKLFIQIETETVKLINEHLHLLFL